jgi:2,3-bisphosphoglycerate-independent phosphoglycerate mutase
MTDIELLSSLAQPANTKMVLLVMDGLGGLPRPEDGQTELEAARTPNLDKLAARSSLGLHQPVGFGITPGSGPGHLGLFGYDPLVYEIGRGVLEALGIDFDLQPNDVAARGNFCTVDAQGRITDRRAGRIPNEKSKPLVDRLKTIKLDGVETFVDQVKEYRFVVVLRGEGLETGLTETDPQRTGVPPLKMEALRPEAQRTADLFNTWVARARDLLKDEHPANMVTLRGPDKDPSLPKFPTAYKLRAGAIAVYPMYRGVAKLVGMQVIPPPASIEEEFDVLAREWPDFDFFFVHIKPTDSRGEDGDFAAKAAVIEQVDAQIPKLLDLDPDVLVVTGDHSTPWALKAHSWHPVPFLLYAKTGRVDGIDQFGERACGHGSLGVIPAKHLIALMLAHAGRLEKFGA